jgi:glyoxylase-like metal-dependent hydrolase (beta-lactamase superfamily II)
MRSHDARLNGLRARIQLSATRSNHVRLKHIVGSLLVACAAVNPIIATLAAAQSVHTYPGVELQGANTYVFRVGDLSITALSDGTVPQDLHELLRDTTNQKTDALLGRSFVTNPVEASINAFLFKLAGRTFLVDTGSGELFPSGFGGKLLQSLAAAGVRPEQITDILLTHAHDDHMGGLVHDGALTFPNATVHVGRADVEFFQDRSNAAKAHYGMNYFDDYFASLKHYVDAGKVQTFDGTAQIVPGITATVHPGQTPGSAFYTVESQGQRIVFVGDIVHVGAVQFPEPAITITYDVDRKQAAEVREAAMSGYPSSTAIGIPARNGNESLSGEPLTSGMVFAEAHDPRAAFPRKCQLLNSAHHPARAELESVHRSGQSPVNRLLRLERTRIMPIAGVYRALGHAPASRRSSRASSPVQPKNTVIKLPSAGL